MQEDSLHDSPDEAGDGDSRAYVHKECGGVTVISGFQFGRITNPFDVVPQTYCAGCEKYVSLKKVAWVETGEVIAAYRRRMRATAPAALRLLTSYLAMLIYTALGAAIGSLFPADKAPAWLIGGAVGFALAIVAIPWLLSLLWRIDNRRVR